MNERCILTLIDPRYPNRRPLAMHPELTREEVREIAAAYVALGYSPECIVVEGERSEEAA
jgi:hypothetical protein